MKHLLPAAFIAIFIGGCAATPEPEAPFHPTQDVNAQSQGGKGFTADDESVVDFGLDEPEVKAFHPTDALLIGGNGGFNPTGDEENVVDLESNQ
ncbi:MAG: hypothetical protein P8K73_05015 [Methylophilaceae bacterium]|nr:hypothetical protein [Methylophilaceae bacterium]